MDPDLFITIAFSSFVFVVGIVGLILITVMVVRSHRRAEGPYEQEEPPAATARPSRRSPSGCPPGRVRAKSMVAPVDRESGRDGSEESGPSPAIVVGIDGSDGSSEGLRRATRRKER